MLWLSVDYRTLNAVTIKDKYTISRIDRIIDTITQAGIKQVDTTVGYHQYEMAEGAKPKTVFIFRGGFYEFNSMHFRLYNALAIL